MLRILQLIYLLGCATPIITQTAEQLVPGQVLCNRNDGMAPKHPYIKNTDICWNIAHELNGPNGHYWTCRPVFVPTYIFN